MDETVYCYLKVSLDYVYIEFFKTHGKLHLEKNTFNFLVEVERKISTKSIGKFRPQGMTQLSRILATFAGDLGSFPCSQVGQLTNTCKPSSHGPDILFWPLETAHSCSTHRHIKK